ncbi:MAG: pyrroloquinoline quinone-dependent dehydrogenase [Gemmatimonadaceae bacterium]|nr:pyrroloquinoline quinone-dependent dehydrogenase [Gemmatimonadaceae bacterium]
MRCSSAVIRSTNARITAGLLSLGCSATAQIPAAQTTPVAHGDWIAYGRDPGGARFSPLTAISPSNVRSLRVAWTFRTGEMDTAFKTRREPRFEATPLMIAGTLYLSTPLGRVFAVDPETGKQRWVFDAGVDRQAGFGDFANRGVAFWRDPSARAGSACSTRVMLGAIDGRLIAIDAATGRPCAGFGTGGTVNLRAGLHNTPYELAEYQITSPPAVLRDLVVVGSAIADNNRIDAASGEVRAFDARTGALRWSWDPVPRDSADAQWKSWIGPLAHRTGAANAWSVIAVDVERDLVFVPTSSPSVDYYGGERLGDNRYANSIVALRGSTGKVVWHFQAVHHDLWDYDVASPPALVTLQRDGRMIPAVIQATKSGQLFVLNRETGEPIFPVEERPVPASTVAGERAAATQPFNTVIPPISPQRFTAADAWGPTQSDRNACRDMLASLRNDGPFTPPSLEGTLVTPSNIGGAHWGGVTYDHVRQLVVVPVNRVAAMVQLIPVDRYNREEAQRESSRLDFEYTRMRGTPFYMRRRLLIGPSGLPCTPPPFGSLVAISLRTGAHEWDVPLGNLPSPSGAAGAPGSLNLGGPIATASGLVFVAATLDRAIRAYDTATGRELWRVNCRPAAVRRR